MAYGLKKAVMNKTKTEYRNKNKIIGVVGRYFILV